MKKIRPLFLAITLLCSAQLAHAQADTSDWKSYKAKHVGVRFLMPQDWVLRQGTIPVDSAVTDFLWVQPKDNKSTEERDIMVGSQRFSWLIDAGQLEEMAEAVFQEPTRDTQIGNIQIPQNFRRPEAYHGEFNGYPTYDIAKELDWQNNHYVFREITIGHGDNRIIFFYRGMWNDYMETDRDILLAMAQSVEILLEHPPLEEIPVKESIEPEKNPYDGINLLKMVEEEEEEEEPVITRSFSDVHSRHPNKAAIDFLVGQKIVQGYNDNTFKPSGKINRAEFVKILMGFPQEDDQFVDTCLQNNTLPFSDVPADAWFAPYVCAAYVSGLVKGYPDGTFRPAQSISFVEAAKIISIFFVDDIPASEVWYEAPVRALADRSSIPTTIASFSAHITRGEMSEMMYRMSESVSGESLRFEDLQ